MADICSRRRMSGVSLDGCSEASDTPFHFASECSLKYVVLPLRSASSLSDAEMAVFALLPSLRELPPAALQGVLPQVAAALHPQLHLQLRPPRSLNPQPRPSSGGSAGQGGNQGSHQQELLVQGGDGGR